MKEVAGEVEAAVNLPSDECVTDKVMMLTKLMGHIVIDGAVDDELAEAYKEEGHWECSNLVAEKEAY